MMPMAIVRGPRAGFASQHDAVLNIEAINRNFYTIFPEFKSNGFVHCLILL
jgi:hypothetical protein